MIQFPSLRDRRREFGGDRVVMDRPAAPGRANRGRRAIAFPAHAIERIAKMEHPHFWGSIQVIDGLELGHPPPGSSSIPAPPRRSIFAIPLWCW
jgi:hypothetical protein